MISPAVALLSPTAWPVAPTDRNVTVKQILIADDHQLMLDGIRCALEPCEDFEIVGEAHSGSEVLTKITGTLPGQRIEDLFHLGDGTGTYDVSFGLTDADQLRTATLTGPFFPGTTATYVLTLTDYGKPVEVTRP